MAKTIEQIQTMITTKADAREVINEIADYLEANSGSGGSSGGLESYQNSVMSSPMQCYVWRDGDGNISRVWEPIQNNDISVGNNYSYSQTIDVFPFDAFNVSDNKFMGVRLDNISSDAIIKRNVIHNYYIDGGSQTGFGLRNCTIYGHAPNTPAINITGQGVDINVVIAAGGVVFQNMSDSCYINDIIINGTNTFDFNNKTGCGLYGFVAYADTNLVTFNANNKELSDTYFGGNVTISVDGIYNGLQIGSMVTISNCSQLKNSKIGNNTTLNGGGFIIQHCQIGEGITLTASGNVVGEQIVLIANAAYQLGVSGGNVTATAV